MAAGSVCMRVDGSGFFTSVRWTLSCSFSRSRGRGWAGRSASTAEATGNCSTSYKQQCTPCSRACDRLPLTIGLLPKPGLGECLPWPGHPGQEPSYRRPGKPESRRDGWERYLDACCVVNVKFYIHIMAWVKQYHCLKCDFFFYTMSNYAKIAITAPDELIVLKNWNVARVIMLKEAFLPLCSLYVTICHYPPHLFFVHCAVRLPSSAVTPLFLPYRQSTWPKPVSC